MCATSDPPQLWQYWTNFPQPSYVCLVHLWKHTLLPYSRRITPRSPDTLTYDFTIAVKLLDRFWSNLSVVTVTLFATHFAYVTSLPYILPHRYSLTTGRNFPKLCILLFSLRKCCYYLSVLTIILLKPHYSQVTQLPPHMTSVYIKHFGPDFGLYVFDSYVNKCFQGSHSPSTSARTPNTPRTLSYQSANTVELIFIFKYWGTCAVSLYSILGG